MDAHLLLLNLHHGDGLLRLFSLALFLTAAERFDALNKFNYLRYRFFLQAIEKLNLKLKSKIAILVSALIQTTTNHLIEAPCGQIRAYEDLLLRTQSNRYLRSTSRMSILEHRRAFYVPEAIFGFSIILIRTYSLHDGSAVE